MLCRLHRTTTEVDPLNGELMNVLKDAPLLAGAGSEHLDAIARLARSERHGENDLVFREGEPCGAFYFVVEGLVKLFVTTNRNHLKIVEFIAPGDTFAEAAMFSGQGYPVSALAVMDSRLIRIDAFGFTRYLQQHPDLCWSMLAQLSRRSHYLVSQIRQMALQSARAKVADYLLQRYSAEEPEAPLRSLPTRRADLAAAVGVTVETLCRVLSDFRNHRWIETRDSAVVVSQPDKLQRILREEKPARPVPAGTQGAAAAATERDSRPA